MKVHGDYKQSINQDRNIKAERQDIASNTLNRSPETRGKHPMNATQTEASTTPQFLESSKKILTQTPEIDMRRVREIRERIAKGTYNIKPDHIADKILRMSVLESGKMSV